MIKTEGGGVKRFGEELGLVGGYRQHMTHP